MLGKKKYILSVLFFLFLIFITYFFVLKNYDINILFTSLKQSNPIFLSLAFLFLGLYVFFEALFLKRIFKHLDYKISFYQAIGYVFTEIYFSAITPSSMGGQPVQMIEMKKDGIPYQINSVAVLLNTMIYKIALIFLACLAFLFYGKNIFGRSKIFVWLVLLGFITTIFVIIFFGVLIYSKKFGNLCLKITNYFIDKVKFIKNKEEKKIKLKKDLEEYHTCAKVTKQKPLILFESFVILLGQRLSVLIISYFIYRTFGLSNYSVGELIAFQVCITLGSDFMPLPGGVMVSEGLLMDANVFLYGDLLAPSGMVLQRSISFYFLVIISGISYIIFHFKRRNGAVKNDRIIQL